MRRCVINVATGHYQVGQLRLSKGMDIFAPDAVQSFLPALHPSWPTHKEKQYAFKAYALQGAAEVGYTQLLWADACIFPLRSLEPIWEHAAKYGVWMCANYGFRNLTWTADSAYPALFPDMELEQARQVNAEIPHVIATAFALDLSHPAGRAFLAEYYRLASQTNAFCGPWINRTPDADGCSGICGPEGVQGHRHDQTCASVIAWRLGIPLVDPPLMFAYKGGEGPDTILLADGAY